MNHDYRIIFMQRPLAEVLASQEEMLRRRGTHDPAVDSSVIKQAFQTHLYDVNTWLNGKSNLEVLRIPYHRVLEEPRLVTEEIAQFLKMPLNLDAMVVLFRYTSNQKAIRIAKDQLKAHLLAVRLYQDQLPVVLASYGRIVRGTGRYLRLAFTPLLIVILPITFLIVQLDRYFGWTPLTPGQSFLVTARAKTVEDLDSLSLQLPEELKTTAPAVHVPADKEVVWRVEAAKNGAYDLKVNAADHAVEKSLLVSPALARVSPERLRAPYWKRMFVSGESALSDGPVQSIAVDYPVRTIAFAGFEWNWIWLFFVLSLVAGFLFKSVLGIEI